MPVKLFSDVTSATSRATQIFPILIAAAANRQTLTYGVLADMLGFGGAGVFATQLGHIMHWCADNDLPPLTVLVVNAKTGLPGAGLWRIENLHADREKVFGYSWYQLVPPTIEELNEADKARKNAKKRG